MMTEIVWHEIRTLAPELFRCDLCDDEADTIHLVPWCGVDCEQVVFACPRHDPGGYWFQLDDWFSKRESWERHLDEKIDHDRTTAERPGGLALLYERERALIHPVVHTANAAGDGDDAALEELDDESSTS